MTWLSEKSTMDLERLQLFSWCLCCCVVDLVLASVMDGSSLTRKIPRSMSHDSGHGV